jgi:hypothetical protein
MIIYCALWFHLELRVDLWVLIEVSWSLLFYHHCLDFVLVSWLQPALLVAYDPRDGHRWLFGDFAVMLWMVPRCDYLCYNFVFDLDDWKILHYLECFPLCADAPNWVAVKNHPCNAVRHHVAGDGEEMQVSMLE